MLNNYFRELPQAYLIAEIGVNHNGDMALAREMILQAKSAGADAVKFQTFQAENLATISTPKVRYQEETTLVDQSHFEMLRQLELSKEQHQNLFDFCKAVDVDFLSTPYDIDSAKFLYDLGVRMFKTASADIIDLPLQRYIASTGLPAIVATGMSGLGEIEPIVDIYEAAKNTNLVFLHCVSNYPCSDHSLNLNTLKTLANSFCIPIGLSDHSLGSLAAVISTALGAKVIEKHFTLDKTLPGPDHKASSTPREFSDLVQNVRRTELMLGSYRKKCQPEEQQMSYVSKKSITLSRAVSEGQVITIDDLCLKRPGTGIHPAHLNELVGMTAKSDLATQYQIHWKDVE